MEEDQGYTFTRDEMAGVLAVVDGQYDTAEWVIAEEGRTRWVIAFRDLSGKPGRIVAETTRYLSDWELRFRDAAREHVPEVGIAIGPRQLPEELEPEIAEAWSWNPDRLYMTLFAGDGHGGEGEVWVDRHRQHPGLYRRLDLVQRAVCADRIAAHVRPDPDHDNDDRNRRLLAAGVSATLGGGAVNITANGKGIVRKFVGKTVNSGDTYQIAIGNFDLTLVP